MEARADIMLQIMSLSEKHDTELTQGFPAKMIHKNDPCQLSFAEKINTR